MNNIIEEHKSKIIQSYCVHDQNNKHLAYMHAIDILFALLRQVNHKFTLIENIDCFNMLKKCKTCSYCENIHM
jgi:hypothetical protein